MASFDLTTFLKVQGQTNTGAFEALGMAYGLPSCMLNIASDLLNILPSSVLGDMKRKMLDGQTKANEVTAEVFRKLMLNSGIIEFDTRSGVFRVKSQSAWLGMDNDSNQLLDDISGLLEAFQYYSSFGAQLYQNYENIGAEIDAIKNCLDKWNTLQSFQSGNSATQKGTLPEDEANEQFDDEYSGDKQNLEEAGNFIRACQEKITAINKILRNRELDSTLEPCFLDSSELDPFLEGTSFIRCPAVDPGIPQEEVFRLTYGPPLTSDGQYVLTSDGLYYDSKAGGLDPVFLAISGIIPPGDKWKFDYDPNLGGRGDAVSIDSLNKFADNLFDPTRVDDSVAMETYYQEDHFLSVLRQQRDKFVYDLSADLQGFIADFGEGSAIVKNQRQLIISEIANHNDKMNRRKKQIEVILKVPQIYGDAEGPIYPPGEIPVNDFSFLQQYNLEVDLEKQKALVFSEGEVNGVVLPITPKFVKSGQRPSSMRFQHLNVPSVGKGSIIYTPSGSVSGTVLSLTDQIVNDKLFAIYNFLETDVLFPSSTDFQTTNCATMNMYNNAQLLAPNPQTVFFSGLGIPYLEGVVINKVSDTAAASGLGSFVRLPDTDEYREMAYSPSGFTMDCWAHVPNIMDGRLGWLSSTASSLTKVLLGCENVGAASSSSATDHLGDLRDLDFLENDKGSNYVRGMVCGFTRDRRITQVNTGFSNNNFDNDPASSLSFFIAPTQSRDLSSASFINNDDCQDFASFFKMKVDLSATAFGGVSSQFVHIAVTVDPPTNSISMYADGNLVATSSLPSVFGTLPQVAPELPSFKHENSFSYTASSVDGPLTLKTGPEIGPFFTPWVVGGGWTDGMYRYGNFLGGDRGGITSGLRGHIGSLKFYSRALDNTEIKKNFDAQKGFFKKILI